MHGNRLSVLQRNLQLTVNVMDVNDNAPVFQGLPYQTVVNEVRNTWQPFS